jgi:hypothetical protein
VDEVSQAELLECARAGRILDGRTGADDERRLLPPELLRRLCRDLRDQVDPRGIRVRDVVVPGELDLAGLDIPFPLRFESCAFGTPLRVEGAQLSELAVTGSTLPGLLANGVRLRRDLDLSGSRITGATVTPASQTRRAAVWLCESRIGGRLLCSGTVIRAEGERAIQADLMLVGGAVRLLDQFTAFGEVRLIGVRLGGSLDLVEAHMQVSGGHGLDLTNAVLGSLFIIDSDIQGRLELSSTQVSGQLQVRASTLSASAGPGRFSYSRFRDADAAVSAPRLTVGAEVTLEGGCAVSGGLNLSMARLSSLLVESGCSLRAPGRTALDLTNAEVRSTVSIGEEVPVEGTIRLAGAAVHGDFRLKRARLSAPAENDALVNAQGARIDGRVDLEDVRADGGPLSFRDAVIGGTVQLSGARLSNPDGHTLSLVQASVRGTVRLNHGFQSAGKVVLNRAVIQGRLLCTGGIFSCPGPSVNNQAGHALEAISATVSGGMDLGWDSVSPSIDFTDTKTSFLADDLGRWPAHFTISGFSYERLEQPQGAAAARTWDPAARCAWLRGQDGYDAGPYEQAARVFRQHGYSDGAKAILIAQRRHARSAISGRAARPRRVLDAAYELTVGYGFQPARVLWLIAALLILVTVTLRVPAAQATMRATTSAGAVYTTVGPLQPSTAAPARSGACGDGQVRCFNAVFYAIDTVIPLISLDQRDTWYPESSTSGGVAMEWWLNLATILGWLLSSVFVLSLASFARST